MAAYCVESPDRDFIPSRLVTVEPPRTKTKMTTLPTRRVPTAPPIGIAPVAPVPMSPSTARLMARPKAGRGPTSR